MLPLQTKDATKMVIPISIQRLNRFWWFLRDIIFNIYCCLSNLIVCDNIQCGLKSLMNCFFMKWIFFFLMKRSRSRALFLFSPQLNRVSRVPKKTWINIIEQRPILWQKVYNCFTTDFILESGYFPRPAEILLLGYF